MSDRMNGAQIICLPKAETLWNTPVECVFSVLFVVRRHVFHKMCVDPWLNEHCTCPMCKLNILKALGIMVSESGPISRHSSQTVRLHRSPQGSPLRPGRKQLSAVSTATSPPLVSIVNV